jgi:ribosomal protein L28
MPKRTTDRTQTIHRCMLCNKGPVMGVNKPHSQKRTKRVVKANLQPYYGLLICTGCLRTMKYKAAKATTPTVTA